MSPTQAGTIRCPGVPSHHVVVFNSAVVDTRGSSRDVASSLVPLLPFADLTVATSEGEVDGAVAARHVLAAHEERASDAPLYVFGRAADAPAVERFAQALGRPSRVEGRPGGITLVGLSNMSGEAHGRVRQAVRGTAAGAGATVARILTAGEPEGGAAHLNPHLVVAATHRADVYPRAQLDVVDWDRASEATDLGLFDPAAGASTPLGERLLHEMRPGGVIEIGAGMAANPLLIYPAPVGSAAEMLRVCRAAQLLAQAEPDRSIAVLSAWDLVADRPCVPRATGPDARTWQSRNPSWKLISRTGLMRVGRVETAPVTAAGTLRADVIRTAIGERGRRGHLLRR